MKKLYVSTVSILFAALCLMVTACNQGLTADAGGRTGTVRIVIGGNDARAVDAAGLPVFDKRNTEITVTEEGGTKLKDREKETSLTLQVEVGKKITVEVVVRTPAGVWRGSKTRSVTQGDNPITVALSKAPKGVGNILISNTGRQASLKLASGANLVPDAFVNIKIKDYPVTARDSLGRVYVLYNDTSSTCHLKRFNVEGNEDSAFPSSEWALVLTSFGNDIAVDVKTDTLFFAKSRAPEIYYANKENGFRPSGPVSIPTPSGYTPDNVRAVAAYNGVVYVVLDGSASELQLLAYKATLSDSTLTLVQKGNMQPLSKLRNNSSFGDNPTECTGLFADENGVYCLLREQNLYSGTLYALGQIVRYQYSGSAFTGETKIGLNSKAAGTDSIPFETQYFSNPVGFIGYDEDNLYIADDGINVEYINENWRINGNKNRIAVLNRKFNSETSDLPFTDTAATWYEEQPEYKRPNTPVLLWKIDSDGMLYWTSADGTESENSDNRLFKGSSSVNPTDVFCYDQDGNLYILWTYQTTQGAIQATNYKVRRFELQEKGSYNAGIYADLNLQTSHQVNAIAVDISNGENYLYYPDTGNTVKRFKWGRGQGNHGTFDMAGLDQHYSITLSGATPTEPVTVTALAANKDGVFLGIKQTYKENNIDKYRLKVLKYKKADENQASPDSEITLVDNAVSYTDVADPPNPIADPNPGQNPNAPCNQYQEEINDLQIVNGMLYGISSKLHRKWVHWQSGTYLADIFRHSSILYTIGDTAKSLPNNPLVKKEKPVDDTNKVGYGFYRFIAVKYDEAERIRLIIASDSAWGEGVTSQTGDNTDKIVEVDLKDMLFGDDKESGSPFSKTFNNSGFAWH